MQDTKDKIAGKFDDAANKAKGWTPEVSDKARAPEQAPEGSTAGGIVNAVKEKVHDVAVGASDLAGKAKDKVVEFASAAASKAGDLGQGVTALIRRYPLQALLVGFGVGFLVAQLIRRRS
jgi:ElaB/YqjD/DUF883 family membrane-anchored ribosome-binding protein